MQSDTDELWPVADVTGTASSSEFVLPHHEVVVPFDDFEIVVVLGPDDRFLGIREVRMSRGFLSLAQKIAAGEFHDIEKFYQER